MKVMRFEKKYDGILTQNVETDLKIKNLFKSVILILVKDNVVLVELCLFYTLKVYFW